MLGVDRLDMIKGIPQKLLAFEKFLEEHPEWRDKALLVQIAVPSRTDVPEYQVPRAWPHCLFMPRSNQAFINWHVLQQMVLPMHVMEVDSLRGERGAPVPVQAAGAS
jgi:trehalose-6-phosphate synthase